MLAPGAPAHHDAPVDETEHTSRRPLDGLLVVAVEQAVAAPLATARLADAGARVIKIERADGDFARGYDTAAGGDSSYFAWANHGKESLAADLKDPGDAALVHRILASADVFVQNLAPGAAARAGFDPAELRAAHPRLITCDISGYGDDDAVRDKKAYDLLVQAESGLVAVSGPPGELGRIGVSVCDIGTGVTAHAAILEALVERSITGRGRGLAVSLFDVAAEWMTVPFAHHAAGTPPTRVGLRHPSIAPYGAFETSDGHLTLISIQNEREWVRLCGDVLERSELATDPRFGDNDRRVDARAALDATLAEIIGRLDRPTFQARLSAASIAFGNVSSLDDLATHAALRRRSVRSSHGEIVSLPAHPVRHVDGLGTVEATRSVPAIDAQGAAIRAEFS